MSRRAGPASAPRLRLVVVAASTGGPEAVTRLLGGLPTPFPVPIVVVQHMPPLFTAMFSERLAVNTGHEVLEAVHELPVVPGRVIVARGDHHLRVLRRGTALVAALDQGPLENSCRPAADVLFRSAAEAVHGDLLAVVLTGIGRDGCAGAQAVVRAGGRLIVQDQASSVVWGMPGSVVEAGLPSQVLPLDQIPLAVGAAAMVRVGVAPC